VEKYGLGNITTGSPVMIAEEQDGHITFIVPHYKQIWLARDFFGRDVALHLKYKMSVLDVHQSKRFNQDLMPLQFNRNMETGQHWEDVEIIQAFFRANDPIIEGRPKDDQFVSTTYRPWVCTWQLVATDPDKKKPLDVKYYRSKPFMSTHYSREIHETYARTPAWFGMADILGGQQMYKSQMQLAELKARPPIWTLKRIRDILDRKPGGITEVEDRDYKSKPEPFGAEGDYLTSKDMWERVDTNCRRWFAVDFLLMFNQMSARGGAPPTATQVIKMGGEQILQVVPAIQGVERSFLVPVDERVFEILNNAGQIPRPPDRYLFEGSGVLEPVFTGPLAQAQRQYMSFNRLNTALTAATPLMTLDENSRFKLRVPDMVEKIFEEAGVWQDTLVGKDEYTEILEGLAEQERIAQEFQAGQATAETIKQLQGPTDPTSPLAQLVSG
jgi:hypothetical protein